MLNAILLHMISCFIGSVILALPVPTLTQVYLQAAKATKSGENAWEVSQKW